MQDKFKIEYSAYKGGRIYETIDFSSFEEAQKHRDFLLMEGNFDPIIKKSCKERHGLHTNPRPIRRQSLGSNRYSSGNSSFGSCGCNPNTDKRLGS